MDDQGTMRGTCASVGIAVSAVALLML
jgi:hypothetical protein